MLPCLPIKHLTLQSTNQRQMQSSDGDEAHRGHLDFRAGSWSGRAGAPLFKKPFILILPASLQLALTSRQQHKQPSVSSGHRRVTAPQPRLRPSEAPPLTAHFTSADGSRVWETGAEENCVRQLSEVWQAKRVIIHSLTVYSRGGPQEPQTLFPDLLIQLDADQLTQVIPGKFLHYSLYSTVAIF